MNGLLPKVILGLAFCVPLLVALVGLPAVQGVSLVGSSRGAVAVLDDSPGPTAPRTTPGAQTESRYSPLRETPPPTLAIPTPPPPTATPSVSVASAQATPTRTPGGSRTHTVQRGDELRHIASNFGVSMASILAINDIPNPDSLRVGQVLTIPDQ